MTAQLRPAGARSKKESRGSCKLRASLPASCFLRWIQLIVRRSRSAHLSLSVALSLPLSLSPPLLCPSSPPQNKECISSSSSAMAASHRSSPLNLTLQKIVCLSADFIPTRYLPGLPYPAAMSELSFALYSQNPGIHLEATCSTESHH